MNELYLVTGAFGYLGSVIVDYLSKSGKRVRALGLKNDALSAFVPDNVEIFYGNVCDKESLVPFFENAGSNRLIVIHAAGIVSIASKFNSAVFDVNVNGTKNVADLCLKYGARMVHISSVHAIPEEKIGKVISETLDFDPNAVVGLYAQTKAAATAYVLKLVSCGLDASIVHPSGIVGPFDHGQTHITQLIIDYYTGHLTACVEGGYDFVDVRDVARGVIACVEKGKCGECYILSNKYFAISEILNMLHDITGKRLIKTILPSWFARLTAPLAEFYYRLLKQPPLYTAYSLYTVMSNSLFSNEKARTELGYTTHDMYDTLTDSVQWLKSQGRFEKHTKKAVSAKKRLNRVKN
ncbi:MAG: NAD-dependent epimerase/dehydratase family protein [Clostridia bacterium]